MNKVDEAIIHVWARIIELMIDKATDDAGFQKAEESLERLEQFAKDSQ